MRKVNPYQPGRPRVPESSRQERSLGDHAFHALPLLRRLADALHAGCRFHDACQHEIDGELADRGGRVQFLNEPHRPGDSRIPRSIAQRVASRSPELAQAWTVLADQIDDAVTLMAASGVVRRAARAIPQLIESASAFAERQKSGRILADILAMPEDETVLVLDPVHGFGLRVRVRAIATVAEFHMLLAEIWPEGAKPDRDVIAAYHQLTIGKTPIATARFQLLHPRALQDDGTIPSGFQTSEHWIWNDRPLHELPRIGSERTLVVAEPIYTAAWEAIRLLPFPVEKLEVIDRLGESEVREWIRSQHVSQKQKPTSTPSVEFMP